MPTVSVIVPFYKAEEWWQQCLHSIRSQSYENVELIIEYDDEATGVAAARNRALDKASGEFVMFVDADDYLEPDAIEKMVSAIEGMDLVVGSFRKFGLFEAIVRHETETFTMLRIAEYTMSNLQNPMSNQMLSGCWAKLYRRSLIGRFPNLTTAEDMAFNFDYLRRCQSARFIPEIIYHNRKHKGSLTTTFNEKDRDGLFGFMEALKYVRKFIAPFYPDGMLEAAIDNSKAYHSMLYFMRIVAQNGGDMKDTLRKLYP